MINSNYWISVLQTIKAAKQFQIDESRFRWFINFFEVVQIYIKQHNYIFLALF